MFRFGSVFFYVLLLTDIFQNYYFIKIANFALLLILILILILILKILKIHNIYKQKLNINSIIFKVIKSIMKRCNLI